MPVARVDEDVVDAHVRRALVGRPEDVRGAGHRKLLEPRPRQARDRVEREDFAFATDDVVEECAELRPGDRRRLVGYELDDLLQVVRAGNGLRNAVERLDDALLTLQLRHGLLERITVDQGHRGHSARDHSYNPEMPELLRTPVVRNVICDHLVQVYRDAGDLAESVAVFLAAGFERGEPAVLSRPTGTAR